MKIHKCLDFIVIKFMFSKKDTKIDEIFTVNLTLCSKFQIDGEDFINFCGLLRKQKLKRPNPVFVLFTCSNTTSQYT